MTGITRPLTPRLSPLRDEELTPDQEEVVHPNGTAYALNITRTLARNPQLLRSWTKFASYLMNSSSLPARDREILILRTGFRCNSAYELAQHRVIARQSCLDEKEIDSIWSDGSALTQFERSLIKAVDELVEEHCISDATWTGLAMHYQDQQLIDTVFTVGNYINVSIALNSFGVQIEPDFETFWSEQA